MSSQWEALPQRTRKRRPINEAASSSASAPETGLVGETAVKSNNSEGQYSQRGTAHEATNTNISSVTTATAIRKAPSNQEHTTATQSPHKEENSDEGAASALNRREMRHGKGKVQGREQEDEEGSERGERSGGDAAAAAATAAAAEATTARHAAVTTAVEERSRMTRFVGGLEGGAGADGANFEYLDHTADVQLHSWGDSIERAMEGALCAMFNVITDIGKVEVDPCLTRELEIQGHDAMSLLFALLDEFLFLFHAEGFAVKKTTIGTVDRKAWKVTATTEGEAFDLSKHPQGTEVKAITYSNMQINEDQSTGRTDIYVIVDI